MQRILRVGTSTGFDPGSTLIQYVVASHLPKPHSDLEKVSENFSLRTQTGHESALQYLCQRTFSKYLGRICYF